MPSALHQTSRDQLSSQTATSLRDLHYSPFRPSSPQHSQQRPHPLSTARPLGTHSPVARLHQRPQCISNLPVGPALAQRPQRRVSTAVAAAGVVEQILAQLRCFLLTVRQRGDDESSPAPKEAAHAATRWESCTCTVSGAQPLQPAEQHRLSAASKLHSLRAQPHRACAMGVTRA